ncbi:MAG TPA: hypothetical protein VFQ85_17425 [Mycobacteriales bacterium]|jgi:hypothetical protein|nr:hypothetical protein [Mycobacteriales bacterium]
MRAVRPRCVLLAVLLVLSGCTSHKKPPDPDAEGRRVRGRLAVLAQATANAAYDATYKFVQHPSNAHGAIRIRQSPPQYRIDVVAKGTASFFALRSGTVSCSQKGTKKTCFLVARPGEEVPALFDPGVQRLFRDAVSDLATNPNDYVVTEVPAPSASASATGSATPSASATASPPALPVGECFAVTRAASAPPATEKGGFEDGTYCFAEQGVATSISVASGTLTLTALGPAPGASAFKPPTTVQKLPDLTPTPTPTPTAKK